MRLRRCGSDAVLVEVSSLDEVAAVRAAVRAADLPQVAEVVPAARTVLVKAAPGGLGAVRELLDGLDLSAPAPAPAREVVLPVRYDGPDLELVAETAGLAVDEVVALHTGAAYEVAFCGFAPGFGYLTGLPEPLRQPRLDSPRTRVPAGSVAVAGEFTAAYPRATPGGWRLIGTTDAPLFDPERDEPALLAPGDRVRFEAL
ncbi:5-oxoprolinase subunit B family protein [Actinosynnema pretiosum]|uniref:Allophanate hydrolase n=1 Tax=Actinosynnema pretiosum TaxID=42197 RepID=A0A290ZF49_9PSEU|nr:allophanate hydrolase subunit 1 [Actinosynnema pretiosum]ATE57670.1 allophanate hydrolase [Actinosynnema pretiosum]